MREQSRLLARPAAARGGGARTRGPRGARMRRRAPRRCAGTRARRPSRARPPARPPPGTPARARAAWARAGRPAAGAGARRAAGARACMLVRASGRGGDGRTGARLHRADGAQLAARAARVEGHGGQQARHVGGQVPGAHAAVAVRAQPGRAANTGVRRVRRAAAAQHPVPARRAGVAAGAGAGGRARRAQRAERQRGRLRAGRALARPARLSVRASTPHGAGPAARGARVAGAGWHSVRLRG